MSHETTVKPYPPHFDQPSHLEGRLTNQERAMSTLLEQAFRVKEDVISSIRSTQGSLLMEASDRKLLENHIQTITHIVKQLGKDIELLEAQIVQRDGVTLGTSMAVHTLDHKNMAGIGDLRGRVARCDASIAKLSGDVTASGKDLLRLQEEVSEMRSGVELRLRSMELKLSQALGKLETAQSEREKLHRRSTTDLQNELQLLEAKSRSDLEVLEQEMVQLRKWMDQQLLISAQTHTQDSKQQHTQLRDSMMEAEERLTEQLGDLALQLEKVERRMKKEKMAEKLHQSESKLLSRISALEKSHQEELKQIRGEYQSGFQAIHDAIDSLRHIGDSKARLDKSELQKDIRQIRRKMAGLGDS